MSNTVSHLAGFDSYSFPVSTYLDNMINVFGGGYLGTYTTR